MIVNWMFVFSIPLSFIGFIIKYKTEIKNYFISIIIIIISVVFCTFYFKYIQLLDPFNYISKGFINGILIASVSISTWDSAFGLKKFMSELLNINRYFYSITREDFLMNKERLQLYRRKLLKNFSIVFVYAALMVILCMFLKLEFYQIIDNTVSMTLGCIATLIISDLLHKAYFDKDKLNNFQYLIVIFFVCTAVISFTVAYYSHDWTVFIASAIISFISTGLSFFLAHFSYLPSLRTKEEVLKEEMDKKWAYYETISDDAILEDMVSNIKYYYKKKKWRSDLDTSRPMFLDNEGVAQSAKSASIAHSSNEPINKAKEYFSEIIDDKNLNTREVR